MNISWSSLHWENLWLATAWDSQYKREDRDISKVTSWSVVWIEHLLQMEPRREPAPAVASPSVSVKSQLIVTNFPKGGNMFP